MVACVVTGQLCLLPHAAPSTLTVTPRHQRQPSVRALRVHPSVMSASRQGKWSISYLPLLLRWDPTCCCL